jgi:hypothetical protein
MIKKLFLLTIVLTLTYSCKSTLASATSTPISVRESIHPLDADITVDTDSKIEGESKSLYFLFFRINGDNKYAEGVDYSSGKGLTAIFSRRVEEAKSAAAYKAVKNSGCDVIVHPNYDIDVEDWVFFKKINVKVSGYKGTINKIWQNRKL